MIRFTGMGRLFLVAAALATAALALALPAAARVRLPPHGTQSVHDLAGVLSPDDAGAMERLHQALFDRTGVAIVVITVAGLDGEPIEDFAVRVGTEWGAGKKGEDRGIVIAFARAERRVYVATGYGVEGFLPDGRVGEILDAEALPSFRRDDFSTGLRRASQALVGAAAEEYGVTIEGATRPRGRGGHGPARVPGIAGILLIIFVVVAVLILIARHPVLASILLSSRGLRGGGFRGGGFGGGFGSGGFRGGGFGGFGGGGFGGGGAGRGF